MKRARRVTVPRSSVPTDEIVLDSLAPSSPNNGWECEWGTPPARPTPAAIAQDSAQRPNAMPDPRTERSSIWD
ncbi:MAG: hypothetical protein ABIR91_04240 [Candidatus Saccharimonadales bacterium]